MSVCMFCGRVSMSESASFCARVCLRVFEQVRAVFVSVYVGACGCGYGCGCRCRLGVHVLRWSVRVRVFECGCSCVCARLRVVCVCARSYLRTCAGARTVMPSKPYAYSHTAAASITPLTRTVSRLCLQQRVAAQRTPGGAVQHVAAARHPLETDRAAHIMPEEACVTDGSARYGRDACATGSTNHTRTWPVGAHRH